MSNGNWLLLFGLVAAAVAAVLFAAPSVAPPVTPYVDAGPDMTVDECYPVRLAGDGYDPAGGKVAFQWKADENLGSFDDATVLHPLYTTPEICGDCQDIPLTLAVSNAYGLSASDSLTLHVCEGACQVPANPCSLAVPSALGITTVSADCQQECSPVVTNVNQAPSPNAGADIALKECASVQLTCTASDPDGDALTYQWTASGNRGAFDNANVLHPIYTAPAVACGGTEDVTLTLTVTDSCGASTSDSMIAHVAGEPETSAGPILPLAGADDGVRAVYEGECLQLHGVVCDPDGNLARVWWTAEKGHFDNACTLDPVYCAPMLSCDRDESVRITLHATDRCGEDGSDYLVVTIKNVNHPAEVTAGPDMTVVAGSCAQLICSASDLDGDALEYHWHIVGRWGYLDNPHSSHPAYTAPLATTCSSGMDVILVVTVTDTHGLTASDSMLVHVINGK